MTDENDALLRQIADDVAETKISVALVAQKVDNAAPTIEEHTRALYGHNGDAGMIGILNSLCKTVAEDHKLLFGEDDDLGLKGKVSVLMKANDSVTKWKWIVISAASSSLVGGLIAWAIISRLP